MTNPVLTDIRGTQKITLPGYPNSEVEVYDTILYADAHIIDALNKDQGNPELIAKALGKMIKGWNFTDAEGKELAVNRENIEKLTLEAMMHLVNEIHRVVKDARDAKKKS